MPVTMTISGMSSSAIVSFSKDLSAPSSYSSSGIFSRFSCRASMVCNPLLAANDQFVFSLAIILLDHLMELIGDLVGHHMGILDLR